MKRKHFTCPKRPLGAKLLVLYIDLECNSVFFQSKVFSNYYTGLDCEIGNVWLNNILKSLVAEVLMQKEWFASFQPDILIDF